MGAMHEDVDMGGQATFIWLEEEVYLISNTGVPYKVYNSVPVVLYLKPFRTTGCTS
jgi:hypothetical protein